jgi:hypothetical protein
MANPTSNFGWQMPTNTDLVKDLPADFEVFGQAVDTDLADLKGGTTGQVLSKTSGTDLDFTWVTPTDQTPLTTKGDLFGYSTADARIPIGTDGQILTADSAQSLGLKWATPIAAIPTFYGVEITNAGDAYSIANNTWTKVTFNQETYDAGGYASSGSTITIPSGKGGYYLVTGWAYWDQNATGSRSLKIYKNGSAVYASRGFASNASIYPGSLISNVVSVSATDTIELYAYQNSGGSLNLYVYPVDAGLSAALIGA